MRVGSMFAGIGGLDLAVEAAFVHLGDVEVVWQLDQVGGDVRARHWPAAVQVVADIENVDPRDLSSVDLLCAGFPCTDLSTAGTGAGLEGVRSGLYRHVVRFARSLEPELVIIENVPRLLTRYQQRLEEDWASLGYGLTWGRCKAADAGAPHLRDRVFIVAVQGAQHRGIVAVQGAQHRGVATATAWPTPTAGDSKASGSRSLDGSGAHAGTSLTDAVRPDRTVAGERAWATPAAGNFNETESHESHESHESRSRALVEAGSRPVSEPLGLQARPWASLTARDYKCGDTPNRVGTASLSEQAAHGKRLNPDWVETLQGLPIGWTQPTGPSLHAEALDLLQAPRWPRGRYPVDWDRAQPWPGFEWEPRRLLPPGPSIRGRPARLRALGNMVVPQQGALGISLALHGPRQLGLFWSTS